MKRGMKRTAALAGRVLGIVLAAFAVLLVVLTVTEHTPEPDDDYTGIKPEQVLQQYSGIV